MSASTEPASRIGGSDVRIGNGLLVSIIIRNYNCAAFLRDSMDSALAQTYRPLEVIVVDDGSTDNSRNILNEYLGRCRIIFRPNGGEGAAVNTGFSAASGEIVMYLDADDVLDPAAVRIIVEKWKASVSRTHFRLWAMSEDGRLFGAPEPGDEVPALKLEEYLEQFGIVVSGSQSCNAYAAWALRKILPLPESDWLRGPDTYLNALTTAQGDICLIQTPLGGRRRHSANLSLLNSASIRILADVANILPRQFEAVRRFIGDELWAKIKPRYTAYHWFNCILSFRLNPSHRARTDRLYKLFFAGAHAIVTQPKTRTFRRVFLFGALLTIMAIPRMILARILRPMLFFYRWVFRPRAVRYQVPIPGELTIRHWRAVYGLAESPNSMCAPHALRDASEW